MPTPVRRALVAAWTPVALCGLVLVLAGLSQMLSPELQLNAATMMVYLVVVVGLYMFIGNSGVVSFGHISFMAIGAYVAALLTLPQTMKSVLLPELPGWLAGLHAAPVPAALAGGLVAALLALVLGPAIMRLSGVAASIAMLAVLEVTNVVLSESESITRGTETMIGIPRNTEITLPLIAALVAIVVAFAYQRSGAGLRLRATREDEISARGVGITIPRERTVALILSAFTVGVGGGLFGYLVGAINPGVFYLGMTFTTIVMLVVGGMRSLTGAVLGTVLTFIVSEILRKFEPGLDIGLFVTPPLAGLELIGLSLIALAVLILRPAGITAGRETRPPAAVLRWLRATPRPAGPPAPPTPTTDGETT